MLKFLLILILLIYTFYRVASFLYKFVFGGVHRSQFQSYQNRGGATEGKVNVDKAPNKRRTNRGYEGGEYVDFEEIK